MNLIVNGNNKEFRDRLTVSELLKDLEIEPARVAVEVNMSIIRKVNYSEHILKEGDAVEIVNFVGGG